MFKGVIPFISLILLIASCGNPSQPRDGFVVNGNINGLGNDKVLVIKFINGGIELDSIGAANDAFTYSGKVKEPHFVQLMLQPTDSTSTKLTEFMLENSAITIIGSSPDYDSVHVSGSKSDEVLKAYLKEDEKLSEKWNELKVEYDLAVASNDSIQRKTLAKELNKIFIVDRVNLLKKYVAENANTTVGALLPSFCTIQNALSPEDYQELYNTLTDSIKLTDYGQSILEGANSEVE